ncbi:MAG: hypothetical protein RL095_3371 [Verrucomicrobiota bacterium]|jgi:hypothetical protein
MNSPCPSFEEISAAIDGEADLSQHFQQCEICRELAADLRRAEAPLRRAGAALPPPPAVEEAIRRACARQAEQGRRQRRVIPFILSSALKVAAVLGVAGLVHFLVKEQQAGEKEIRHDIAKQGKPEVAPSPVAPPKVDPVLNRMDSQNIAVDASKVRLAAVEAAKVSSPGALAVPDQVEHVWISSHPADAMETFRSHLPAKVEFTSLAAEDALVAEGRLSDAELVALVDKLATDSSLQLLSPGLPQPGTATRLKLSGKPILYRIKIAQR